MIAVVRENVPALTLSLSSSVCSFICSSDDVSAASCVVVLFRAFCRVCFGRGDESVSLLFWYSRCVVLAASVPSVERCGSRGGQGGWEIVAASTVAARALALTGSLLLHPLKKDQKRCSRTRSCQNISRDRAGARTRGEVPVPAHTRACRFLPEFEPTTYC